MDSKKTNKISEIVRLQQILKKWKKLAKANAPKPPNTSIINKSSSSSNLNTCTSSKGIKFLKKTLSFSDRDNSSSSSFTNTNANNDVVPKGYLAVCVGKKLKRFIIPTEYLGHQAFGILLREAEEEFGFQQEGVLKIPCEVPLFEKILKMVQEKREIFFLHDDPNCFVNDDLNNSIGCYSPDQTSCELTPTTPHPQLCR